MSTLETKSQPEFLNDFKATVIVASPGRINLIGEHTDYNHGYVLPTAIDKKIYLEFNKNASKSSCNIYSKSFENGFRFDLKSFSRSSSSWENYILGVVNEIQKKGKSLSGFDCIIKSDLPIGAGISSSAALECGLASGLNELFNLGLSKQEIIELSQRAENNFVGSNCGIMDQYTSVMSKKGHLILLDCESLKAEYIPSDFDACKILLLNTNVAHNLAEGEYNSRRRECEEAVGIIQQKNSKVNSLRDVDFNLLKQFKKELPEQMYRRAFYVLEENQRVLDAAEAIKQGDLKRFGDLMYRSHEGLQHQYEVSCAELDFLVDFSRNKDFVHGSRMMGGGFGGCTINIIKEAHINSYIEEISGAYLKKFNIKLDAISVLPGEGTVVVKE